MITKYIERGFYFTFNYKQKKFNNEYHMSNITMNTIKPAVSKTSVNFPQGNNAQAC